MKILVVTNLFPNPLEPVRSTFNEEQIASLAEQHELEVVSPIDSPRWFSWLVNGQLKQLKVKAWKGISAHYPLHINIPKVLLQLNGWLMFVSLIPTVLRLKSFHPDVIYAAWAYPDGFAVSRIAKWLNIPYVLKVHGSDIDRLEEFPRLRKYTTEACGKADSVIAVSEYLKRKVVDLGLAERQVHVIKNGIDKSLFNEQIEYPLPIDVSDIGSKNYILFVGNLKKDKGVLDLLKAFKQADLGDFSLVFVGAGPEQALMEKTVEELDLGSRVKLLGRKPKEEVAAYMCHAKCLVLPSYHEGLPNVLNESVCLGTPVVATDVGGIPEVVNDGNGALVSVGDVQGLGAALRMVVQAEYLRERVANSLNIFDWSENSEKLFNVLQNSVRKHRI